MLEEPDPLRGAAGGDFRHPCIHGGDGVPVIDQPLADGPFDRGAARRGRQGRGKVGADVYQGFTLFWSGVFRRRITTDRVRKI